MTRGELLAFLQKHRLGVVATTSPDGDPQSAVVGIAVTDQLEIVFDTLSTTRKCRNLRRHPQISVVVGWDQEITVQYEGIADEPTGSELERLKRLYFLVYPYLWVDTITTGGAGTIGINGTAGANGQGNGFALSFVIAPDIAQPVLSDTWSKGSRT